MATLYVTEYQMAGRMAGGTVAVAFGRRTANNNVAIGGVHAESNAFGVNTRLLRVHSDAICSIAIGSAPAASTSDARMAANQTEYYQVNPGDKISVITNT